VNDAPTDLSLSANTVAEHATTGTVVGTVSGTDPDASDTKTYSLTDTAGGRFTIDANTGQLTVANGSLLNYEASASHTVTVRVTDSGGQSYDETFTINLTNMNEAPTDLALSANTVTENATTGTVVGTVTGTDVDAGDTKTYSLTDTAGGRFAIDSATGQLTVANGSLLNYEAATSHTVTVRVTDSGGQSYNETFTINLTNVNETVSGSESINTLIEDMAHTLATSTLGTHDTYGAPKTSSSDPHVTNELEESGFPLANTFQNMSNITTEAPSTEITLTAEQPHLSVASEEPIGNGVSSKETQRSSTQNEKRGSDVPANQTDVHGSATTEAERKDFLEPDAPIDPIENVDTSTTLKQSATMILASVALQNGLGNNTKLRRLFSRPADASNVSPETMPQQSPVDDHASNQSGSEHSRTTAEDADQT
jgi:VCBS repeat-containing protein